MVKTEDSAPVDSRFDLAHLIRSVQRIEGNPDCFGKAHGHCDQANCCWRVYCLPHPWISATQSHGMDK
ncbi:MAG: SAP domain-containing protein [Thermodesulfobacteriota bacterium]